MRIVVPARFILLVFVLASTVIVRAQFQAPTDAELKMTSDPKAPGAAAVYLNIDQVAVDALGYESYYARIKVLSEKAINLADVEIPYQRGPIKITEVKARTIHPDGTVIPLTVKSEDLLIVKEGDWQYSRKVFTLPSVEVGSIIEYRFQVQHDTEWSSSPTWEIQRPYFVHKAHFAFTPSKGFLKGSQNVTSHVLVDSKGNTVNLLWWTILPPGVELKTDASGRYSLDATDIPARQSEDWMPPSRSLLYKVVFYYEAAYNAADFWATQAKEWAKETDQFAEPTKPIREAVSTLIAPGDSDLDKARKLYKAVQGLDNTDFSRKKGQAELKELGLHAAKRAEDTWSQKSGSRNDIALLYLAMLRAAGLTAYEMKVVDRDRNTFAMSYLYFDQLDDDIVILNLNGKEIFLDPGEKMCPFQMVHWKHSGAGGVRESPDGRDASISPLLPFTGNSIVRSGDLTVDSHGAVTGTIRLIISGQEALRWRQTALRNDDDEVRKQFDNWLQSMVPGGVEAHVDHFTALDNPDADLMAVANLRGTLGTATSKRLILPGFFFDTRGTHPFVNEEKRLDPVDMHYGDKETDQVVYHLPPDVAVEGAPRDATISWPSHAVLVTKTTPAAGQVTIGRTLARAFTFAKPEEYQDLRGFYQKVAAADQQELVLSATPAAKGN